MSLATLPQAECRAAALDAAIKAHLYHFTKHHTYVCTQDAPDVDNITAYRSLINKGPPLTYTVKFEVPGLQQPEGEAHLIAIGLAEPPKPPTTSITFRYWLDDEDFPIIDKNAVPAQCTDHNCPLGCFFHYKGLFVDEGTYLDAPEQFGNTCPPSRIWDADKRVKLRLGASDMDRKLVKAFAQYHYWYYGQEYEGSYRALVESEPES